MSDLRGVIDDVLINHVVSRKRGTCHCGHVFQLGESFTAHHTDLILAALRVSPSLVPWLEAEGIVEQVGVSIDDDWFTTEAVREHMPFATPPGTSVERLYRLKEPSDAL